MARQVINIGDTANDGTGDRPRTAGQKINANFSELYSWARERVSSNRTYYVATTGSDANTGLSPGVALLTIQQALSIIANTLSIDAGVTVTISVANGTYTLTTTVELYRFTGPGAVLIQGNTGTPGSCIITTNTGMTQLFLANNKTSYAIQGFRLQATTGSPIGIYSNGGNVSFGSMEFNTGLGTHVTVDDGGLLTASGNYTIIGSASEHMAVNTLGQFDMGSVTVTLSGTPAFSTAFATAERLGLIQASATFSGSATGTRYSATTNSVIDTNGGGASYIPGNAAGSTSTGGQYV